MMETLKHIDERELEANPKYRFEYLAEFIGFTPDDAASVLALGPHLGPMIPEIVERTYERLLAYDATARHFVSRQSGFDGPVPENLADLGTDHPQIRFRKEHLSRYFMQVLGRTCDTKLAPYFDMVGKIHTSKAGSPEIDVPLVQMNALMGFLSDLVMEMIAGLSLDAETALRASRAFNKLLWIQNDSITRQYKGTEIVDMSAAKPIGS